MAQRKTIQRGLILRAMLEAPHADWYGLELLRETGLKSGTIYPALAALERSGILSSHWEDVDPSQSGRPRRRLYRLDGNRVPEAAAYVHSFDYALAAAADQRTTPRAQRLRGRLA